MLQSELQALQALHCRVRRITADLPAVLCSHKPQPPALYGTTAAQTLRFISFLASNRNTNFTDKWTLAAQMRCLLRASNVYQHFIEEQGILFEVAS